MSIVKRPFWIEFTMLLLIPIIGMAVGVGTTFLLGLNQTDYGNLIVNLFFLMACIVLIRIYKYSSKDLGLRVIKDQTRSHFLLSLVIFTLYILFYIFAIRISGLKPFSANTAWGLLTYLIVVIAEELYFRGALFSIFEKRFSAKTALIVTSILFGLFHAQQGLRGIISKMFTGWLWGSVRYFSGMIFLLIVPIHFNYNAVWLLFEGNWSNPPAWAIYALPAFEFIFGLIIVLFSRNPKSERAVTCI